MYTAWHTAVHARDHLYARMRFICMHGYAYICPISIFSPIAFVCRYVREASPPISPSFPLRTCEQRSPSLFFLFDQFYHSRPPVTRTLPKPHGNHERRPPLELRIVIQRFLDSGIHLVQKGSKYLSIHSFGPCFSKANGSLNAACRLTNILPYIGQQRFVAWVCVDEKYKRPVWSGHLNLCLHPCRMCLP